MAYVLETDVNRYGYLHSGDKESLVTASVNHSWLEPFPPLKDTLDLAWTRGSARRPPDVFHHNVLRDFVCNIATHRALTALVNDDVRVIARGHLDDRELVALQVTTVLDVVDVDRSAPAPWGHDALDFPHIPQHRELAVKGRFFRVPNPGLSLTVLVGDDVKDTIEEAGIRGWRFTPARIDE